MLPGALLLSSVKLNPPGIAAGFVKQRLPVSFPRSCTGTLSLIAPKGLADARNDAATPVLKPPGEVVFVITTHFLSLERCWEVKWELRWQR